MNTISEKIIAALLTLFLLSYVGYQAFRKYYNPVETETIFEYTVVSSMPANGIAIRSELVLEEHISGVENYIFADATRVSVGQSIAEFYTSSTGDDNIRYAREIEDEINMLKQAQDTTVNNFANADIISRNLKEQLAFITNMASTRRFDKADLTRKELVSLINRKKIATGSEQDYSLRIAQLEQEYLKIKGVTSSENVVVAKAPVSGYFVRLVDGYEITINTQNMENYTIEDYKKLLEMPPPAVQETRIGKMITNSKWYFAIVVPEFTMDWMGAQRYVDIQFESFAETVPARVYSVIQETGNKDVVVLFECDRVSQNLFATRTAQVTIHFQQFTGLRINTTDIRFQGEQKGIFVLEENTVKFKKIDAIYEEASFVLSRTNYIDSNDKEHVCQFDQLIKGNDLYDGKVIQ